VDYKSHTLTPSGTRFSATLAFEDDRLVYTAASGISIVSAPPSSPTGWRHVVLSHSVVRGETFLYLDGGLVGSVKEMLQPDRFTLGGSEAPSRADYRDWLIYRSALNGDEVAALHAGQLLQASLEMYAPLADARLTNGQPVENRAQSLAVATVAGDRVTHAEE
jgi:hypothetical protein